MLVLKEDQENARESIFWRSYDYALTLGKSLDIEPDILRIAGKQIHRANVSALTPFDCCLRNICLLFLDHLIGRLNTRFDQYGSKIHKMHTFHCVKSVRIGSYSGSYFPAFGLNKERYGASLRIQPKCGKLRTRTTPNTDTFHAAFVPSVIGMR